MRQNLNKSVLQAMHKISYQLTSAEQNECDKWCKQCLKTLANCAISYIVTIEYNEIFGQSSDFAPNIKKMAVHSRYQENGSSFNETVKQG